MSSTIKDRVLSSLKHSIKESWTFTSNKHVNGAAQAVLIDARVIARVGGLCFLRDPLIVSFLTLLTQGLKSPFDKSWIGA